MSRIIEARVRTSALQVSECVRSLFALEFLHPGSVFYLCIPVIYNSIVLTNRMGQFSALFPEMETESLRLDAALALLAARGEAVRLIHEPGLDIASLLPAIAGTNIAREGKMPLHHKGLLTRNLCLRGALHFNDNGIDLITDHIQLQRLGFEMDAYWEELA